MNHDYMHCSDFTEDCPEECFRAQLVRDLEEHPQSWISFGHLRDTEECWLNKNTEEDAGSEESN